MEFWSILQAAVGKGKHTWITLYHDSDADPFTDKSSMLNQDMGVRALHAALNDIFFHRAAAWQLQEWRFGAVDKSSTTDRDIDRALSSLRDNDIHKYLQQVASAVSGFDWRSLDGPDVRSSRDEIVKRAYRGSGGYMLLTSNVLTYISKHGQDPVANAARDSLPPTQTR